ncbi:MAG: hypothetical protein V4586_18170 [Pseudomonadota bacterium]
MKSKRCPRQTVPGTHPDPGEAAVTFMGTKYGNQIAARVFVLQAEHVQPKENTMKGIAAYFLGIPIVVIILLYVTGIF